MPNKHTRTPDPMDLATPPLRDLAARLLTLEARKGNAYTGPAVGRVCEKLGSVISMLAGAAGFHSLLSRALALARTGVPSLSRVTVLPDGKLEGLGSVGAGATKDEADLGGVILVAHLLGLLILFIGEPLTLQLLKQAWPNAVLPGEEPHMTPSP